MDTHQKDQHAAVGMLSACLAGLTTAEAAELRVRICDYLLFREATAAFLKAHFAAVCTDTCYRSRLSACCSRDGIIVHFADVAINTLMASAEAIEALVLRLSRPHQGVKCIYLGEAGCLWTVKPIGCEMFLCDRARQMVFEAMPDLRGEWAVLETRRKTFTWPDRPVLFDRLEAFFIAAGLDSPLMYYHKSPGLLRVKRMARICSDGCR